MHKLDELIGIYQDKKGHFFEFWWQQLEWSLGNISFTHRELQDSGFLYKLPLRGPADYGVDSIRINSFGDRKVSLFQLKNQAAQVSKKQVEDFFNSRETFEKLNLSIQDMYFLTTSTFSPTAEKFCYENGIKMFDLEVLESFYKKRSWLLVPFVPIIKKLFLKFFNLKKYYRPPIHSKNLKV
jgi:hypothetical protein